MAIKRPKRPRDPVQLGKLIGDILTGQAQDTIPIAPKLDPALEYARRGGLKGGAARAKALSAKRRKEIAKAAAVKRWRGTKKPQSR